MKLRFTQTAIEDLKHIREFTLTRWGKDQEDRYLRNLYKKLGCIRSNPAQWQFREDLFPRCQIAYEGRHTIMFRVDDSDLLIVRVLHNTMDLGSHVPDHIT